MTLNLVKTGTKRTKRVRLKKGAERKELNDSIKMLVDYATFSGSKSAHFYYANISKLINKMAGVDSKATATKYQMSVIKLLESATRGAILSGLAKGSYYKDIYSDVKTRIINLMELI